MTIVDTLQRRKCGIRMGEMSETFQEAIILYQSMSIDYLWIDSLCILLGNAKARQTESDKMADYYGLSWLTAAATAALDWGACFAERRLEAEYCKLKTPGATTEVDSAIYFNPHVFSSRLRHARNHNLRKS